MIRSPWIVMRSRWIINSTTDQVTINRHVITLDHRQHYDQVTMNRYAIITLALRQDTWHTVLGKKRQVQDISQNFVARVMAVSYCTYEVVYRMGAVARTNIASSSILRSVRTVCVRPISPSSSKLNLPCEKHRSQVNTTLRFNAPSP